ncbi:unnamed protein product [Caenorhabditis sp. 36 PRJEB53466]|nr:unnamed protein product [Caenorhabditis sp. 36 PRJEB53466]
MNVCVAINRCFVAALRCGSKIGGSEDALLNEDVLMTILNAICGFVAVAETSWIVFFLFTVQIPYDYEREGLFPITFLRFFCACWLAYSVPYHYWKARVARPIKLPQTATGSQCTVCEGPKPKLTSHCSTCGTCIYKMDHHCPWIGQCVGAHNQAHFFLFLWNVFLATVLVLYVEYDFWIENWKVWTVENYDGKGHGRKAVFTVIVVVMLHIIMVSFLSTYAFLVSGGLTYVMKMFNKQSEDSKQQLTPSIIHLRWRKYLAVRRGEWILKALFVPSDRIVRDYNFFHVH